MTKIIVSAVNIVEGGTLTVLRDCLMALSRLGGVEVVALVKDRSLAAGIDVQCLEFPTIKGSWLRRLWFEYVQCKGLSERLQADIWIALHDMTPKVVTPAVFVYTHNPMWQYRIPLQDALYDWKLLAFALMYRHLYRINIRSASAVIVQQQWLKTAFVEAFAPRRVIVAHPVNRSTSARVERSRGDRFFYPALPRSFKNHSVLLDAWAAARSHPSMSHANLHITVDGTENRLTRDLRGRHATTPGIVWHGLLRRDQVEALYDEVDCLVFPSRVETWGLPLSEARARGCFVIASDHPYAHESLDGYRNCTFFAMDSAADLSSCLVSFATGDLADPVRRRPAPALPSPDAASWDGLCQLMLDLAARPPSSAGAP